MNLISKIGTIPFAAGQSKASEPPSPGLPPSAKDRNHTVPPSLSTYSLSVSGSMDTSTMGLSENQLKRQGLECLVAVLRSLVAWSSTGKTASEGPADLAVRSQTGDDMPQEAANPDPPIDRASTSAMSAEALRQPTPDISDDPSRFESAKQKKTTLLEGIKKFNFKPKRVSYDQILLRSILMIRGRVYNTSSKLVSSPIEIQQPSHTFCSLPMVSARL